MTQDHSNFTYALAALWMNLPRLLVIAFGAVLAIRGRRRHLAVSCVVLFVCLLELLPIADGILSAWKNVAVVGFFYRGIDSSLFGSHRATVQTCIHIGSIILLVSAVFAGRHRRANTPRI